MNIFRTPKITINIGYPILDKIKESWSSFDKSFFPWFLCQNLIQTNVITLNLFIFGKPFMEMALPIKHFIKNIVSSIMICLLWVIFKTKLYTSPFHDLRITFFGYQSQNFFSKFRYSKIGIGTKNLSKSSLIFRTFMIYGI